MVITLGQQYDVGDKPIVVFIPSPALLHKNKQVSDWVGVVVFFTLTNRASIIPRNIRGCQSGTWSAGQKKIRGTSTKLQ